jgi:hypothetical protein
VGSRCSSRCVLENNHNETTQGVNSVLFALQKVGSLFVALLPNYRWHAWYVLFFDTYFTCETSTAELFHLHAPYSSFLGANHLRDSDALITILAKQKKQDKFYAAICAAPAVVLAPKGLIEEGATCYPAPGFREKLVNPSDDDVVVTGKLTTSKGPGTALKFALELGEQVSIMQGCGFPFLPILQTIVLTH